MLNKWAFVFLLVGMTHLSSGNVLLLHFSLMQLLDSLKEHTGKVFLLAWLLTEIWLVPWGTFIVAVVLYVLNLSVTLLHLISNLIGIIYFITIIQGLCFLLTRTLVFI